MTFPDKLRWSLFAPGERVLIAVSGGPDSLSLLHVLWSERQARGLRVEAAHLDHGLRGEESAAEATWVADWCAARGIPCHAGRADVARLAKARKRSKQEAARTARYAFLEETAAAIGATKIATGHTQDDQVETILMNVLRGTGLDGLRGIPARRGLYVRPLLGVSRAEVEDYCAAQGLEPRRDPSNLSPDAYTRNRIRLELLPQLERRYNPGVRQALLRLSEIAGQEADFLGEQAKAALGETIQEQDAVRFVLDRPALAALHPALLRRVLRAALLRLRGTTEGVSYEHLEQTCLAIIDPDGAVFGLTLPAPLCRVRVTDRAVTLALAETPAALAYVSVSLPVPGKATMLESGWTVEANFQEIPGAVSLDADTVQVETLTLRTWKQGDRIDPLGMGGRHKKVGDIFTDAKVPRVERRHIPIVGDAHGLIWVAGHALAERAKITPSTRHRLYLSVSPAGGKEIGEGNSSSMAK